MRAIMTLLTITLLTSSCKNIEKMVDKGNYDQAIDYAVDKLEGEKNKKTKYVKALEKAYIKVNQRDLYSIEKLLATDHKNRYDKIYDIYSAMERRQLTVLRLDPLISKDGYVAEFPQKNYVKLMSHTGELAAESHYNTTLNLLNIARNGDKNAAREAYTTLGYIERYNTQYKDTDNLYRQAYELGVDHVGVTVKANTMTTMGYVITDVLYAMDVSTLDDFWTRHHLNPDNSMALDYLATIQIESIEPGFEKEYYNRYEDTKEVLDGTKPVRDLNGQVVKDTLGNVILTNKYRTAKAYVTELHRQKSASLTGKTIIYDANSKSLVKSVPLSVTHIFEDYSATYQGERLALSDQSRKRLKEHCDHFPSDYDMITAMADNFRNGAYQVLDSRYRREY